MLDTINQKQITDVLEQLPDKIVLSNLVDKTYLYKKIVIQRIVLKGREVYQIERFTEKQAFHENVEMESLDGVVLDVFPSVYSQLNIFKEGIQWDFKVTKKGKLLTNRHSQNVEGNRQVAGAGSCVEKDGRDTAGKRISVDGTPLLSYNRKFLLPEES